MPPAKGETPTKAELKAAYQEGYDAAMAEPLDPDEPGIKQLTDAAYAKGYEEGLRAGRPVPPPFERAKQFVRDRIDLDAPQLTAELERWQHEEGVTLNSSDLNLLRTFHERLRARRRARADAQAEMRPAYSTTREPEPAETEYQVVT